MCNSLWKFDYREADELAQKYLTITNPYWKDPTATESTQKSDLMGKTVVITGKLALYKNRAELAAAIEQAGGKVASSVSKNTDYLINNDNTSGSAKNVSAQKLGIPVVTEQEFVEKFL
jgi:DNA ligase (NAD+)